MSLFEKPKPKIKAPATPKEPQKTEETKIKKQKVDYSGKIKSLEDKLAQLQEQLSLKESPKEVFTESFWESWVKFAPSVDSMFKEKKWPAMYILWTIIKREVEKYKKGGK